MTALQQLWLASALGAVTFFAAGALVTIIRLRSRSAEQKRSEARRSEARREIYESDAGTRLPDAQRAVLEERLAHVEHALAARTTQLLEASSEIERLRAQVSAETLIDAGDAEAIPHDAGSKSAAGSITEALSRAIARFSDPKMRCATVVDEAGFLVSSPGDGGVELAGYAALLNDAANKAAQFLPVTAPASIELIDEQGARISVWPFHVDDARLLLVKLGIGATEERRVQRVLSEVIGILKPSNALAR